VKGNIITNFTDEELVNVKPEWRHLYKRVWDITDLAVPPVENSAFFVTTNLVITPNQTRGECPELHDILPCRSDLDCKQFLTSGQAHGIPTGICNKTTESCILSAWCPLEEDVLPLGPNRAVLEDSKYFTVLIKNMVKFPKHILEAAGCNYSQVAVLGAVINIDISWNCDLDRDLYTHCRPIYNFNRLDNPEARISPGSNFRHADYFNQHRRSLTKAFGITFIINVHGEAGKFNIVPTLLNLGAGLALLSLSTIVCDIIVLYFHKHRNYYKLSKYQEVQGEDAFLTEQDSGVQEEVISQSHDGQSD